MKKLISVIPITILICLLLSPINTKADTVSELPNVYLIHNGDGWRFISSRSHGRLGFEVDTHRISATLMDPHYNYGGYGSYDLAIAVYNDSLNLATTSSGPYLYGVDTIIVMKGQLDIYNPNNESTYGLVFGSEEDYNDYINPPATPSPTPNPTPELTLWDKFYDWYYSVYGYYPDDDSLFGYFRSLFEDSESSGSGGPSQHSISTHRPHPSPTPTQIPYSVIIQPMYDSSGNIVNYTYNYSYTSESGETIIVTSPPDNSGTSNNDYNNQPFNPDPLNVPTSALDAWYMFAYDENEHPNPELHSPNDDFGTGMKYIEDNIDEYDKPIDYIMSAINSFPNEWLLLFGMGIGLIFIAGIIGRFLS